MTRASNIVIACILLLCASFGAFVMSDSLFRSTPERDLGTGMLVVGAFVLLHVGITIGLACATVFAAAAWHRNVGKRTKLDGVVLAVGTAVTMASIAYAKVLLWG